MNERAFKAKLRAKFKQHCYIQSMSSLGTAGTPDLWLSGKKDLWLEVKYDETTKGPITPKLTALQKQWLNNRFDDGRQVIVIVGTSPNEAIIYRHRSWNGPRDDRRPLSFVITEVFSLVI